MIDRRVATGLAFLLALACGGAQGGADDATAAKAKGQTPRGAKVFNRDCALCHGESGQGQSGSPPVMGQGALPLKGVGGDAGPFRTAKDVFDYVKKTMPKPAEKAGSLSDADYWAVVEYMLIGAGRDVPAGLSDANAADVVINK